MTGGKIFWEQADAGMDQVYDFFGNELRKKEAAPSYQIASIIDLPSVVKG